MSSVAIAGRQIGPDHPTYIVAEVSANHGQSLDKAKAIIRAARDAGADAVKIQTYTPATMTIASDQPWFRIEGTIWHGRQLFELYGEAYTPWEWHAPLKAHAESLGLPLFSTPFDATAVEFLEGLAVPAHKIASFELVDLPLLERVAATGKPVIMSTGMATLDEIVEAVDTLRRGGCRDLVLLKCTSAYPAPAGEMDLRTIPDLADRFGVVVGLSDHSMGVAVPVAAVTLGARVIEKHLTLSRSDPGPDSAFSLEPEEFRAMVDAVRQCEEALGTVRYGPTPREIPTRAFRRSLFVVAAVAAGEAFTPDNVRVIRPAHGLPPRHYRGIIGRRAATRISSGTPLTWDLVEGGEA